jgi:ferritin-like metal-binding protein YciE
MATADIATLYTTALRNTHALEQQGLQQMESQVKGLENYPQYAQILRDHIATSRTQLQRLDQALSSVGTSASTVKETVTSVAGAIGATVHAVAQDETLKNLFAGYGFQYEQIAAYRSLIVFAEAAGHADHAALFRQSIEEEKRAAQRVEAELIEPVTRQYIERTTRGNKADS